jgi:hypothetical protein
VTSPVEFCGRCKPWRVENPKSVSGMQQGRGAWRGLSPRGSEKGRGGKASGWNRAICRFAVLERWRGGEPHGRNSRAKWQLAVAEPRGGRPRESLKGAEVCERWNRLILVIGRGRRESEDLEGEPFLEGKRREGTDEPNSRYGTR